MIYCAWGFSSFMAEYNLQIINKVKRHQQYVRFGRMFLPLLVLLFVILLFWLPKLTSSLQFYDGASLLHGQQQMIESQNAILAAPNLSGTTGDWIYNISADSAKDADIQSKRIDFIAPKGTLSGDQETIKGQANAGSWFASEEILELFGNATADHSNGYHLHSDRIQMHMETQNIQSLAYTVGNADFGDFEAEQAMVEDNAQTISLFGKSRVVLTGSKPQTKGQK